MAEEDRPGRQEEMGKRWRTALLLLPVLGVALALGGYALFLLTFLVGLGCLEELRRLLQRRGGDIPIWAGLLPYTGFFWGLTWGDPLWLGGVGAAVLFYAVAAWAAQVRSGRQAVNAGWDVVALVLSITATALAFALLFEVREAWGLWAVIWMLLIVWGSDAGAFFTGRTIGGPKLAPKVSPGKTISGFAGGLTAAVVLSVALGLTLWGPTDAVLTLMALGAAGSLSGQLGDLAASVVKRKAQVKDSSNLLPGHGGLLDRFDSVLLGVPVLWTLSAVVLGVL